MQNGKLIDANYEQCLPALEIWMDNQSAMSQIDTTDIREASKHIQVRYYWLKETAKSGFLRFKYIHTGENLADLHTKCFTERKTNEMRRLAGMMTNDEFTSMEANPPSYKGGVIIQKESMLEESERARNDADID